MAAGERVFCAKGVLRRARDSHAACNASTRFALDLAASAFEPPRLVLASADGVAYPLGGCTSPDLNGGGKGRLSSPMDRCNFGFGNLVRIQHEGGVYTQYAHLAAILVTWGRKVLRGEPIGIEGSSGAAGQKHIHWSLHQGNAQDPVVGPTLPMDVIRIRGGEIDSFRIHCGDWTASPVPLQESAYVSENVQANTPPPVFGFPAPTRVETAMHLFRAPDASVREAAIRELAEHQAAPQPAYWYGVAMQEQRQWREAKRVFAVLAAQVDAPQWIRAWSLVRGGEVAAALGENDMARTAFEQALAAAGDDAEVRGRARAGLSQLSRSP